RSRPVGTASFFELDRRDRLEDIRGADSLRRAHRGVIFVDQGLWIDADRAGNAADVSPRIEVTAAAGKVAALDAADNGLSNAGARAGLRGREADPLASRHQRVADAHAAAPRPPVSDCCLI